MLMVGVQIVISLPSETRFGVGPGAGRKFAEPRGGRGSSGGSPAGMGGREKDPPPSLQTALCQGCVPSCSARLPPSDPRVLEKKPLLSRYNSYRFPGALPTSIPSGEVEGGITVINQSCRQSGVTCPSCAKCTVYSFLQRRAELSAVFYVLRLVKQQKSRQWRARKDFLKKEGNSY